MIEVIIHSWVKHLSCWKAKSLLELMASELFPICLHNHLFSQDGGLCEVLVANTTLMCAKTKRKMLSLPEKGVLD